MTSLGFKHRPTSWGFDQLISGSTRPVLAVYGERACNAASQLQLTRSWSRSAWAIRGGPTSARRPAKQKSRSGIRRPAPRIALFKDADAASPHLSGQTEHKCISNAFLTAKTAELRRANASNGFAHISLRHAALYHASFQDLATVSSCTTSTRKPTSPIGSLHMGPGFARLPSARRLARREARAGARGDAGAQRALTARTRAVAGWPGEARSCLDKTVCRAQLFATGMRSSSCGQKQRAPNGCGIRAFARPQYETKPIPCCLGGR
jgi:hypothetical protein